MKIASPMIWITTDTHFNHEKMYKEWGLRPANFEQLIFDGLSRIPKGDVLIHLGDICMGKDAEMHEKYIIPLQCKKWLIRGNHDNKSNSWYLQHGWDFVGHHLIDTYFKKKIIFSHIPTLLNTAEYNVHGHLHNLQHRPEEAMYDGKHLLRSLEIQGYEPMMLQYFLFTLHKIPQ